MYLYSYNYNFAHFRTKNNFLFPLLGAWITIPKKDQVDGYKSLSEFQEKFARYRDYNLHFISDIYDDDE